MRNGAAMTIATNNVLTNIAITTSSPGVTTATEAMVTGATTGATTTVVISIAGMIDAGAMIAAGVVAIAGTTIAGAGPNGVTIVRYVSVVD